MEWGDDVFTKLIENRKPALQYLVTCYQLLQDQNKKMKDNLSHGYFLLGRILDAQWYYNSLLPFVFDELYSILSLLVVTTRNNYDIL